MIVKVCGVRTPEVAEVAVQSGADWIGLVFERRSPRYVDDAAARSVVDVVRRRADLIGVFVEPSADECEAAADRYGLAAVQVHGDIAADFITACSVAVIRGINVRDRADALTLQWWAELPVLLDSASRDGELPGGTGRRLDADLAAEVARHRRIVLAGGLGPADVAGAIVYVRPYGVDASSGLERAPGEKDTRLVQEYVTAARGAFSALAAEP
jgi:phosphoribosylanthranilate isomerase